MLRLRIAVERCKPNLTHCLARTAPPEASITVS